VSTADSFATKADHGITDHMAGETSMLLSLNICGMTFCGGKFQSGEHLLRRLIHSLPQPTSAASSATQPRRCLSDGTKPAHSCHSSEHTRISIPSVESHTCTTNRTRVSCEILSDCDIPCFRSGIPRSMKQVFRVRRL
jgi:hypothetical protein